MENTSTFLVASEPVVKTPDGFPLAYRYTTQKDRRTSNVQAKFELDPKVGVRYEFDASMLEHWFNIHGAVMDLLQSMKR